MTTIALIHGAYQGGWIWQLTAEALRSAGHTILTPTLDGCAERADQLRPGITTESHAAELAALLFYEDIRDAVLVGTSTGGMVIAKTAEMARDRVRRVVFADALALMNGEKLGDIVQRKTPVETELTSGPTREDVENRLFQGLSEPIKQWALERYTMHPIACMNAPVSLESFWNQKWNATVIWCTQSTNPPKAHQERCAGMLDASWFELDTGHYPMLSEPGELARLIALS